MSNPFSESGDGPKVGEKLGAPPVRNSAPDNFDPTAITRPAPILLWYYVIVSLPVFPIAFPPLFFKYYTLKYRFDDTGVSMSWGILFRREIHLTYRRIQDIHLNRNPIQRWMGLATLEIQTASGSAAAEMKIEGILEAEALRDFLYSKMRGAKEGKRASLASTASEATAPAAATADSQEALSLLREIRDALRTLAASSGQKRFGASSSQQEQQS